jgi:hypothetical protein
MSDAQVIWDDADDPTGNTAHVALNDLTPVVVWEEWQRDPRIIYPVTAYDVPPYRGP